MSSTPIITYAMVNGQPVFPSKEDQMFYDLSSTKWFFPLLIGLTSVAVLNLGLIAWIIQSLELGESGLASGNIVMLKNGVNFKTNLDFEADLVAEQIQATASADSLITEVLNTLRIASHASESVINIGRDSLDIQTSNMKLMSMDSDEPLFEVGPDFLSTQGHGSFALRTVGGLNVHSLKSSAIQGAIHEDLRLESRKKSVNIEAQNDLFIESLVGDISASSFGDIELNSEQLVIETLKLELHGLREVTGHDSDPETSTLPYQLCACEENGRLFVALPDEPCEAAEFCSLESKLD
ncbi:Gamma-sarcoglycan [Halotydeus destructor]|nr:Gamma-sarcoglycan [Halotydeus destructor]